MTKEYVKKLFENIGIPEGVKLLFDNNNIILSYNIFDRIKDEKFIAALSQGKTSEHDTTYFFENGLVINDTYIRYDEIIVVDYDDIFKGKIYKNACIICYGDDKVNVIRIEKKSARFVCDVLDNFIDCKNELTDVDKKIEHYIELFSQLDSKELERIIYNKVIKLTNDYKKIKTLVDKYGYSDFLYVFNELIIKQIHDLYYNPKDIVLRTMLVVPNINPMKMLCKSYTNVLIECYPKLRLMQNCNILDGYMAYIECFYIILIYASKLKKKISDELIFDYNSIIKELQNKIEEGFIDIKKRDSLSVLRMIKHISDVYLGKIIDNSKKIKYQKYIYLKNLDKAVYWLGLYMAQDGSDNTVEYEDVLLELANIYKYGAGEVSADEDKMLFYLKSATKHGSKKASKELAEYYIKIDDEEKDKWIKFAKENGQKVKEKTSVNEKVKEVVGMDISEIIDNVKSIAEIFNIFR